MQAFLSIYSLLDWILRGVCMAAQTFAVGGVAYVLLTLTSFKNRQNGAALEHLCMRMLFWAALVLCFSQLLAAGVLTAFLIGSGGVSLATAVSADAVILYLLSASAAFALACVARRPYRSSKGVLFLLSALLIGAHTGVTHAASRAEPSLALLGSEMLHLFALAAWIGGVPYFLISLRMICDHDELKSVAKRFSLISAVSVIVIVATGLLMSFPYVGTPKGIYQTNYGLLLGTKVLLLIMLLWLGAANFLAIRKLCRGQSSALRALPGFAEVEVGIGLIGILCAAALASSPLAADTRAARPDAAEISKRFELTWPRLQSPAPPPAVSPDTTQSGFDRPEPKRTSLDIAWSEAHHHYAAIFVIVTGVVAFISQKGAVWRVARHWPGLFFGLAVYLFIVADEDAWPLGKIGFFESLATPRIAQHKLMILLVAGLAIFEWRVQCSKLQSKWASFVFPATIAAAAAFLLTHYGHTDDKEEVLVEISHTPVALLGVVAAAARWLELRLPSSTLSRLAGIVWPLAFVAAGAFLLIYRESL